MPTASQPRKSLSSWGAGWTVIVALAVASPAAMANTPPQAFDQKLICVTGAPGSPARPFYATDPDAGQTLTYEITAEPSHGAVSVSSGRFTYTPTAGYAGEDSFTWRVTDGTDYSANAVCRILVRPANARAGTLVVLLVKDTLYPNLVAAITRLQTDMETEGYTVKVLAKSCVDYLDVWNTLRAEYFAAGQFMTGAILLGSLPKSKWLDAAGNDLGYNDYCLWNMEKYGDYLAARQIWVTRLYAEPDSAYGDEIALLNRALDANHAYRTGACRYPWYAALNNEFGDIPTYAPSRVREVWPEVPDALNVPPLEAFRHGGDYFQSTSHGSPWGYVGTDVNSVFYTTVQLRYDYVSACNSGAVGGICNYQLFTRRGGNIVSLGCEQTTGRLSGIYHDAYASASFRQRLNAGDAWGSGLIDFRTQSEVDNQFYGDLSMGVKLFPANVMPDIVSFTQTPAGTVCPGQPVTFAVEICDPDGEGAKSPYVPFRHQAEWFMNGYNYGRNAPTYTTDDTQGTGWNSVTHTFTAAGTYTIRAEVMDEWQARDWAELTITVNSPPVAAADTATVEAGNDVTIPVLANDVEPDGEALTLDAITAGPAHGTAVIAGATVVYTATDLVWTGTDTFDYRVKDPRGLAATATVTVTVVADTAPPQVSAVSSAGDPTVVTVVFNERLLPGTGGAGAENPANYAIDQGVTIASATLQADGKSVALAVSTLAEGVGYTLSVEHVADLKSNAMATPQLVCFQYYALLPGVKYEYYEGSWNTLPDFSTLTPVAEGVTTTFDISVRLRNDQFAFRFTGVIQIDTAGAYTFYTTSDDGSKLYLDGSQLVNNDGLHGMQEVAGTVTLAAGYHDIAVTMFEQGGGEGLEVRWEGPGLAKQLVPAGVLFHRPAGYTNHPPTIATPASADPNPVTRPAATNLSVTATDADADPLTYAWTQVTGPGTVTFGAPAAPTGTASFSVAGDYLLRVTVSDGKGASVTSDVSVTVKPHAGDLNGDNVINAIDLQIIIANFGMSVAAADPRADANGDGVINALDLQIVIANFGQSVP